MQLFLRLRAKISALLLILATLACVVFATNHTAFTVSFSGTPTRSLSAKTVSVKAQFDRAAFTIPTADASHTSSFSLVCDHSAIVSLTVASGTPTGTLITGVKFGVSSSSSTILTGSLVINLVLNMFAVSPIYSDLASGFTLPAGLCVSTYTNFANERDIVNSPATPFSSVPAWDNPAPSVTTDRVLDSTARQSIISSSLTFSMSLKFTFTHPYPVTGGSLEVNTACSGSVLTDVTIDTSLSTFGLQLSGTRTSTKINFELVDSAVQPTLGGAVLVLDNIALSKANAQSSNYIKQCFTISFTGASSSVLLSSTNVPAASTIPYVAPTSTELRMTTSYTQFYGSTYWVDAYIYCPSASFNRVLTIKSDSTTCLQSLNATGSTVPYAAHLLYVKNDTTSDVSTFSCSITYDGGSRTDGFSSSTFTPVRFLIKCTNAITGRWARLRITDVMTEAASIPASCWTLEESSSLTTYAPYVVPMASDWTPTKYSSFALTQEALPTAAPTLYKFSFAKGSANTLSSVQIHFLPLPHCAPGDPFGSSMTPAAVSGFTSAVGKKAARIFALTSTATSTAPYFNMSISSFTSGYINAASAMCIQTIFVSGTTIPPEYIQFPADFAYGREQTTTSQVNLKLVSFDSTSLSYSDPTKSKITSYVSQVGFATAGSSGTRSFAQYVDDECSQWATLSTTHTTNPALTFSSSDSTKIAFTSTSTITSTTYLNSTSYVLANPYSVTYPPIASCFYILYSRGTSNASTASRTMTAQTSTVKPTLKFAVVDYKLRTFDTSAAEMQLQIGLVTFTTVDVDTNITLPTNSSVWQNADSSNITLAVANVAHWVSGLTAYTIKNASTSSPVINIKLTMGTNTLPPPTGVVFNSLRVPVSNFSSSTLPTTMFNVSVLGSTAYTLEALALPETTSRTFDHALLMTYAYTDETGSTIVRGLIRFQIYRKVPASSSVDFLWSIVPGCGGLRGVGVWNANATDTPTTSCSAVISTDGYTATVTCPSTLFTSATRPYPIYDAAIELYYSVLNVQSLLSASCITAYANVKSGSSIIFISENVVPMEVYSPSSGKLLTPMRYYVLPTAYSASVDTVTTATETFSIKYTVQFTLSAYRSGSSTKKRTIIVSLCPNETAITLFTLPALSNTSLCTLASVPAGYDGSQISINSCEVDTMPTLSEFGQIPQRYVTVSNSVVLNSKTATSACLNVTSQEDST